ncbi:MAG: ClpXP protease specificity-enhancing factor [Sulfuriferula sp.]|nr:ClpXP protease specificity-enhancing factor [Sulfuriferula sp.]
MQDNGTKPYLIRAIFEWCVDSGFAPFLSVVVDANTRVPMEYVKDGKIVLNLSPSATHGLLIDNQWVRFSARFNGTSRPLEIPITAVAGIFARENGEGLGFEVGVNPAVLDTQDDNPPPEPPKPTAKPKLQVVK